MKLPFYIKTDPFASRDVIERLKTAQLLALLKKPFNSQQHHNQAYWAKCELRRRGYSV